MTDFVAFDIFLSFSSPSVKGRYRTSPEWDITERIQTIQQIVEKCQKGGSCKNWGWGNFDRKNYQKI